PPGRRGLYAGLIKFRISVVRSGGSANKYRPAELKAIVSKIARRFTNGCRLALVISPVRLVIRTTTLRYNREVANNKIVEHHKMVPYLGCRRGGAGNSPRNNIEVQCRRTFDVREVMVKVVRIRIGSRIDLYRHVFGAQFASSA